MSKARKISLFALLFMSLSQWTFGVLRHPAMTDQQARDLADLPQFESRASIANTGCSAAMLSPNWVLFAAHCTGNPQEEDKWISVLHYVDGVQYSSTGRSRLVRSGDPGYDDVALVELDLPITQAVSFVAPLNGFTEYDRLGWQLGRGWYGELSSPVQFSGTYRAMTQRVYSSLRETNNGFGKSVTPQFIYYRYDGSPASGSPSAFTTRYEGGTGPGDSGGSLFIYSHGRFFSASVVSGPSGDSNSDYRNSRMSTHLDAIQEISGLSFAYPQKLEPVATWVAEDLNLTLSDSDTVVSWSDRLDALTWSNATDGGAGSPEFLEAATPTGLSAIRFDGSESLGLSSAENPLAEATAMSVVMVLRTGANGEGLQTTPFGTTGLLDASSGDLAWGLSYSQNERFGLSLEAQDSAVTGIFRGGVGNAGLSDNQWHVVVATWDGSEISHDNAGDDQNMKLFVDSIDQVRLGQGVNHYNVERGAVSLLLGNSQSNGVGGFNGDVAEIRMYRGELQLHEIDRILTAMKARYVSGSPAVQFTRPWTNHLQIPAGQSLQTRGLLTGGATSVEWFVESGPAAVTFSDYTSANTDISFEAPGSYQLRAVATDGVTSGNTDLFIEVYTPLAPNTVVTPYAVTGNWVGNDLGDLSTDGSFSESTGVVTVNGAGSGLGTDEGETYDQGHFVWKGVAGDFDIVARMSSLGNATGPTRGGLMVRGGPGSTDAAAFIGLAPDNKAYLLIRSEGGKWGDLTIEETPGVTTPAYFKLERRGNSISAYVSTDGINFNQIGATADVLLPGVSRVGMFVTSGDVATTVAGVFDNISLSQVGFAKTSAIQFDARADSSGLIEYIPSVEGARDPWICIDQETGGEVLSFKKDDQDHLEVQRSSVSASGTYRSRLIVDDGNAATFILDEDIQQFYAATEFNTNGDFDGWNTNNIDSPVVASGVLSGISNSDDPQITKTGLELNGNSYTQVEVRMKSAINTDVQLYWSRVDGAGFTASRLMTKAYSGAGMFQTLTFALAGTVEWDDEVITALRLDPVNGSGTSGTAFEIDYIRITDGSTAPDRAPITGFDFNGNANGWEVIGGIENDYVLGGSYHLDSSTTDPRMKNETLDIDSNTVDAALVRIRSNNAGNLQIFWTTSSASAFSAARSAQVAIVASGDWQTVRVPLAASGTWTGETITSLRLDPINVANASIEIDAVAMTSGDADGDQIPDTYEIANGLEALDAADANADGDADGQSNYDEYIAGTDPDDSGDRVMFTSQILSASVFEVQISGRAGRAYTLGRKLDLKDLTWTPVDTADALISDGTVTLTDSQVFTEAFYRVEILFP